jgi:glycosyltransferase involved in cell wall biosynthesis
VQSASAESMPIDQPEVSRKIRVSVVIIFLNAERFIREAIESVFGQTYNYWELVLVDDGSTDGSTAIALEYAKRHCNKVSYFEHADHQHRGKTVSRNLGIRRASGEYIAFLDADDVWMPRKLEQQVEILDSHPEVSMVYGLSQWWYSWTGKPRDRQRDFKHELGVPANSLLNPPDLIPLFFLTQQAAIPNPSNILLRRETLQQVNGFDESFFGINDIYEDQAFCAKVCLKGRVFAANECWDMYRQHPNSTVAVAEKAGQEYSARMFFLKWLAGYLSDEGVKDFAIAQALKNELWRCRHPKLSKLLQVRQHLTLMVARCSLPLRVRHWRFVKSKLFDCMPAIKGLGFGRFGRVTPLSREFGFDRGLPIDRYYIERFLADNASDIHGHVLEIADNNYTRRFGGARVSQSDVLHLEAGTSNGTIVGDLTSADHISSGSFDCVILTQTLQFIYDVPAAIRTLKRILKPGGIVLATFPGISPISRYDMEKWGHFWAFTTQSARRLFEESFPQNLVQVMAYGNVLTAASFLYGLATEELQKEELDHLDRDYELVIAVRAVKAATL